MQTLSTTGGLWNVLALVPDTVAMFAVALVLGVHGALLAHGIRRMLRRK